MAIDMHLETVLFNSSNTDRGEMQPMVSHGEILFEKVAPYMLLWTPFVVAFGGWARHSAAYFWSLWSASVSPPTWEVLGASHPSYMMKLTMLWYFKKSREYSQDYILKVIKQVFYTVNKLFISKCICSEDTTLLEICSTHENLRRFQE